MLSTFSLHVSFSPSLLGNAQDARGEAVTTVPFTRSQVVRVWESVFTHVLLQWLSAWFQEVLVCEGSTWQVSVVAAQV